MKSMQLAAGMLIVALIIPIAGCSQTSPPETASQASAKNSAYLLSQEPAEAKGVKQLRADAQDADEVTLVGRIGGDTDPWIKGQAAFLIVDTSLKPCNEQDDDACPTPWDYCCDAGDLAAHKLLVKVVDASGSTVATDARELLGVKELQTVVVEGKAKRDADGNLTVLASGVFVRP